MGEPAPKGEHPLQGEEAVRGGEYVEQVDGVPGQREQGNR